MRPAARPTDGRHGGRPAKARRIRRARVLSDLLGWERFEARRRVSTAEHVCPRIGLDGTELPALLPATATAFAAGRAGLRHVCGYVLDHGDVPECGGRRPHLNVLIRLDDLETRARAAVLDFGGRLSPEALRMLACDAAVVPIVMNGAGQPLDVGRAQRVVPDGLRRAVAARDRGCARCGRPPSWCEIHHVVPWEVGGETALSNCVMPCKACHWLVHHSGWIVRLREGLPEVIPPAWIDPDRHPRRRPLSDLVLA